MNRRLLVSMMAFLLVGCMDSSDAGDAPETPLLDSDPATPTPTPPAATMDDNVTADASNPTWRLLIGNFTPTLVSVQTGPLDYSDGNGGGNCIHYGKEDVAAVQSGTFEASWDSTSPLHDRLRIVVRDGVDQHGSMSGPSPLRVDFQDVEVHSGLSMFITTESDQGVVYDQTVELSWTLTYLGVESPSFPEHAVCD